MSGRRMLRIRTRRHKPAPAVQCRRSPQNPHAFTLIELLVVTSIITLLLAVLLPTLQRVRRQARTVACQAKLRQWGAFVATYVSENDGHLPGAPDKEDPRPPVKGWGGYWRSGWGWGVVWWIVYKETREIRCCPMATKLANPMGADPFLALGGTFLAWGRCWPEGEEPIPGWNPYGSYGVNYCVTDWCSLDDYTRARVWRTPDVSGADRIPVFFDHTAPSARPLQWDEPRWEPQPPACDAIPTAIDAALSMSPCINRHDGGINAVFLDWSVRKVGLKELWTLKWNRQYNMAGSWTKAGGVQPEDWPEWMRSFKDY